MDIPLLTTKGRHFPCGRQGFSIFTTTVASLTDKSAKKVFFR